MQQYANDYVTIDKLIDDALEQRLELFDRANDIRNYIEGFNESTMLYINELTRIAEQQHQLIGKLVDRINQINDNTVDRAEHSDPRAD